MSPNKIGYVEFMNVVIMMQRQKVKRRVWLLH